jgi:hypothetical protein
VDRNSHAGASTTSRRFVLEAPTRSFWHEIDEINEIVAYPGVRAPKVSAPSCGHAVRARRARGSGRARAWLMESAVHERAECPGEVRAYGLRRRETEQAFPVQLT